MRKIRKLVGDITEKELRYVDSFAGERICLFMPAGGACFFALTPLHSHPSYMFVLAFNEETSVRIGKRIIKTEPGKVFALSPGIAHHELPSDTPPRYIAIFIEKDFFEKELSYYTPKDDISFNGIHSEPSPNLLFLLRQFMIESESKTPGSESVLSGISLEICHSLIRGFMRISVSAGRITERIEIDRAIELMHSGLSRKITVSELANIACVSTTHFARIFKREICISPIGYLNKIRLERAKKLLIAGGKSVTDIAFECGFGSPAYLSACFSRSYKISPMKYVNALKKGSISKKKGRKTKD